MKKKKAIIGIIGVPEHNDEQDAIIGLYNGYKNAIIKNNCLPFMIPPLLNIDYYSTSLKDIPSITDEEKEIYQEMVDMCDGLIIQGGYRMYNYCEYIIRYALKKDIPILGICLGMQLLANVDNDIYCLEENDTKIDHRRPGEKYVHNVIIQENTLLKSIIGEKEIKVNSKHRYHVSKVNNYKVSALSEDGLIEGIELPNKRFVLGLQWHPEIMIEYDEPTQKIFTRFIAECQKK